MAMRRIGSGRAWELPLGALAPLVLAAAAWGAALPCAAQEAASVTGNAAVGAPQGDAARLLAWARATHDAGGLPFVIIDKRNSQVQVYDGAGELRGASPALVGTARGDAVEPGIGLRPIASIRPEERVTPAGRFRAVMGRGPKGEDILWVDYDQALALHRVVTNVPAEHRLERLRSPRPQDRRITYGCINVPVRFFEQVVQPVFAPQGGIVYILPESRPLASLIGPEVEPGRSAPGEAVATHTADSGSTDPVAQ
ncbi:MULTISPECIES: L,D-transpeptidase [Ramlibacter]|uniref:L,D-transpeptidase n=1 Tax=Ramlibacter aquaticus TaxID=2780094 RepID=A0ABR9SCS2_9BURK|nr:MULTISPECIES: L,D-transpeptidase [Ramlibacter]MBE7940149.1 L,D-transpeptidase [Ramlibacter aquaticus]